MGKSLLIETLIVVPALMLYGDWSLCQELYDKRHNLFRFDAILRKL